MISLIAVFASLRSLIRPTELRPTEIRAYENRRRNLYATARMDWTNRRFVGGARVVDFECALFACATVGGNIDDCEKCIRGDSDGCDVVVRQSQWINVRSDGQAMGLPCDQRIDRSGHR